jgi:glyoxylase-like metal-dependent hydrolase (beta-lactamase superfamily II)
MMHVGNATIRPVVEIEQLSLPPQMFVDDISLADIEPHVDWLSPQFLDRDAGACLLSQHAWLIEVNGKRILVDPCVGHQRNRPSLPFYHMLDSPFLDRLAALGATPESIDIVFCTHLHLDHCGWNTRLQDGRWVPTFANARYVFSRAEEDFWRREFLGEVPEQIFNTHVYAECVKPILDAGLADILEPGARIADCITLIEAGGHTVGHVAGVLESGAEGAVLAGDAIHHPIQVLYADRPIHADDRERARLTRHRLLSLCAEQDYWLAPAHFRAPHMCKVRRDGAGYRMEWPS